MKNNVAEAFDRDVVTGLEARLQAFRAHHPRARVTIAGTEWSYLLGGHGEETVLFLPGGERIGDLGFTLVEQFEQDYRCLYPSYPPFSTLGELLEGLAALLDSLASERVIVFAASFGGDVGQCFVRRYPQRVSKLILLNTGLPDKKLGRATKLSKPLVTLLPLSLVRLLIRKVLVKALSVPVEEQPFWRTMLYELVANLTRADLISSFDETIDYRLNYDFSPEDLTSWPGKILVLQSDDDPAVPRERREALCRMYPDAQSYLFHQAGHTPFLTRPDEFYRRVEEFLREA